MKKITYILIVLLLLVGCGNKKEENKKSESTSVVIYFSATGTTKDIAYKIKDATDSDIIEIEPLEKYTSDDLNYNNKNSRANLEQNDPSARPEIKNKIDIEKYDTVYIGYPIWWGTNPKIILTLIDSVDLKKKNVILFCTSGSSSIKRSLSEIKEYNHDIRVVDGKRFDENTSKEEIESWVNSLKTK